MLDNENLSIDEDDNDIEELWVDYSNEQLQEELKMLQTMKFLQQNGKIVILREGGWVN